VAFLKHLFDGVSACRDPLSEGGDRKPYVRSIERVYVFSEETAMASTIVTTRASRPAQARSAGAEERETVRLTARGRVVLALCGAAALSVVLGIVHLPASHAGDRPTTLPKTATVVVQPGQTLWQIASRVAPGSDPRTTVHRIEELNGLTSASVSAGQRLYVPAG
jgi:nucleoid-associated protein YgaU